MVAAVVIEIHRMVVAGEVFGSADEVIGAVDLIDAVEEGEEAEFYDLLYVAVAAAERDGSAMSEAEKKVMEKHRRDYENQQH